MLSLCIRLALRPSIHFLHLPPVCIDNWAGNFKFDFGFFNVFFFRKVLYKNSPLKCSWRAYYAPFAVLRYISKSCIHILKLDLCDKNNLQINQRYESCLKPVYPIWFVTLHSFWLSVFTCKDGYANRRTLLEEK